jgi:hypothetical protein
MAFVRDSLRVEIIARDLNRMIEELASIDASSTFSSAVDTVAIRVSAGSMRRTRLAKEESIRRAHDRRTHTKLEGKLYNLRWNYHNEELWRRIENHRAARLQQRLAARGLARQSWYHLGRAIHASSRTAALPMFRAPAVVVGANYLGEQYPQDVATYAAGDGREYQRTIINNSPLGPGAGMEPALTFAMQAETRYFERLMANRFYLTAAGRAARYPGVFVRPQPIAISVPAGMESYVGTN